MRFRLPLFGCRTDYPRPVTDPTIEVRAGTNADDDALLAVERASFSASAGFPSQLERRRSTFFASSDDPADFVVATVNGSVVGYAKTGPAVPVPECAHVLAILGLEVDPSARRRGVGTALLQTVHARAREAGCRKVELRVFATNGPAQALYRDLGYVVEGRLRDEFRINDEFVDDVFMSLFIE